MLSNKIGAFLFIALTAVFASYYGGAVAYGLFYMSLIVPVVSLIYAVYVRMSFKPKEKVNSRIIEKGKDVTYSVVLKNNSFMPYTNIKMIHYSDKKDVEEKGLFSNYCLVPKEEYEIVSKIHCRTRGVFWTGIKMIYAYDFLNIFKVPYDPHTAKQIYVVPKLYNLTNIRAELDLEFDKVRPVFSVINRHEVPDIDMRRYMAGDSRKMIHWKASAKRHELYSRKFTNNPDPEMKIVIDLSTLDTSRAEKAETEDRILETALAVMKYYQKNNKPTTAVFSTTGVNMLKIVTDDHFNNFYNKCAELNFNAVNTVDECIISSLEREEMGSHFVLVLNSISERTASVCRRAIEFGNIVTIILVDENTSGNQKIKEDLKCDVILINKNQGIVDVLERK